jgi:hypothetical protein
MLAMAAKYPDIQFRHCGGLWTDKNPANTGSYFGYRHGPVSERHHRRAHQQSKKIGFVAASPPAGASQRSVFHARRAGRPIRRSPRRIHRRVVARGEGS